MRRTRFGRGLRLEIKRKVLGALRRARAKLTAATLAALSKRAVRERLVSVGIDTDPQDGAALAQLIDTEIARWATYVKQAGITPE